MATAKFAIKHEFARYLISGFSAVATDLTTYALLLPRFGPSPSKTFSFLAATVTAYTLNKFWTFKVPKHSWAEAIKFGLLYSFSLIANVAVNRTVLFIIQTHIPQMTTVQYQFAWLCATGTSTIVNYVGQKTWVFRKKPQEAEQEPEQNQAEPGD